MTLQRMPCFDSKGKYTGENVVMALHDTTGRCIQTFDPKTAARLKSSFDYMAQHHPAVHQRVNSPSCYLEAIQRLATRYSEGTCNPGKHTGKSVDKNQYTLPQDVYSYCAVRNQEDSNAPRNALPAPSTHTPTYNSTGLHTKRIKHLGLAMMPTVSAGPGHRLQSPTSIHMQQKKHWNGQ
eukprot:GHUV01023125.1.p1 GENE.GHUV01023125.1~~GHUV01023125.1.p1  ORF type:complete len:180 (+),score=21.47 GHUV01023125.1:375-914(+)